MCLRECCAFLICSASLPRQSLTLTRLLRSFAPLLSYGSEQAFSGGNDPYCRESLWPHANTSSHFYTLIRTILAHRTASSLALAPQTELYVADSLCVAQSAHSLAVLLTVPGCVLVQLCVCTRHHRCGAHQRRLQRRTAERVGARRTDRHRRASSPIPSHIPALVAARLLPRKVALPASTFPGGAQLCNIFYPTSDCVQVVDGAITVVLEHGESKVFALSAAAQQ